jgi:hypothetical protein
MSEGPVLICLMSPAAKDTSIRRAVTVAKRTLIASDTSASAIGLAGECMTNP